MNVHVVVDPDTCIGSGECVALDPDVIELGDDGIAHVLVDTMEEERAKALCGVCPVGALSVE